MAAWENVEMPCIVILMLLMGPRLVIFLTWFFSPTYFQRAYETALYPLLGFFFMPYTMLCYAIAMNNLGGVQGIGMVVVIIGILVDLGVIGKGASSRRQS